MEVMTSHRGKSKQTMDKYCLMRLKVLLIQMLNKKLLRSESLTDEQKVAKIDIWFNEFKKGMDTKAASDVNHNNDGQR